MGIARELLREVGVLERTLRVAITVEYDPSGQLLGAVVHRHSSQLGQDLSSYPVTVPCLVNRLESHHVVSAVVHDALPLRLRNRLVPREIQLHMQDAQFNLELLQALL